MNPISSVYTDYNDLQLATNLDTLVLQLVGCHMARMDSSIDSQNESHPSYRTDLVGEKPKNSRVNKKTITI